MKAGWTWGRWGMIVLCLAVMWTVVFAWWRTKAIDDGWGYVHTGTGGSFGFLSSQGKFFIYDMDPGNCRLSGWENDRPALDLIVSSTTPRKFRSAVLRDELVGVG